MPSKLAGLGLRAVRGDQQLGAQARVRRQGRTARRARPRRRPRTAPSISTAPAAPRRLQARLIECAAIDDEAEIGLADLRAIEGAASRCRAAYRSASHTHMRSYGNTRSCGSELPDAARSAAAAARRGSRRTHAGPSRGCRRPVPHAAARPARSSTISHAPGARQFARQEQRRHDRTDRRPRRR